MEGKTKLKVLEEIFRTSFFYTMFKGPSLSKQKTKNLVIKI